MLTLRTNGEVYFAPDGRLPSYSLRSAPANFSDATLVLVSGNTRFGRIVEYGIATEGVFNGLSARSGHGTIMLLREFDGVDKHHGRAFTRIVLALGSYILIGAFCSRAFPIFEYLLNSGQASLRACFADGRLAIGLQRGEEDGGADTEDSRSGRDYATEDPRAQGFLAAKGAQFLRKALRAPAFEKNWTATFERNA